MNFQANVFLILGYVIMLAIVNMVKMKLDAKVVIEILITLAKNSSVQAMESVFRFHLAVTISKIVWMEAMKLAARLFLNHIW